VMGPNAIHSLYSAFGGIETRDSWRRNKIATTLNTTVTVMGLKWAWMSFCFPTLHSIEFFLPTNMRCSGRWDRGE